MTLSETEVSSLRTELVSHSNQILDLTIFAVTTTTALIGFGLSTAGDKAGYIVLVPILILTMSFSLVVNRRQNIVRIATYLRVFAGEEFQYESRLCRLRHGEHRQSNIPWANFLNSLLQVFFIMGIVCIVLSLILLVGQGLSLLLPPIAVGLIWILFCIFQWSRRNKMGDELDEILFKAWKDIGESEKTKLEATRGKLR